MEANTERQRQAALEVTRTAIAARLAKRANGRAERAKARAKKKRVTPGQLKFWAELEAWNASCPNAEEQAFWKGVEARERVLFMGGEGAFYEDQRARLARRLRNRDRVDWTILPMSKRGPWRLAYTKEMNNAGLS